MKRFLQLLFISFFFVSCGDILSPTFNEPVKDFFEEYTNNAAIVNVYFPLGSENSSGVLCIPSSEDAVIKFEMRNPQNYILNFDFDFNEIDIAERAVSGYSFTQTGDRAAGTLTLTRDFLYTVDQGNIGNKNISGYITIVEPKSGRSFESYPVSLHANTPPPAVKGACFQRSSENDSATYIVCFFIPNVNDSNMALHTNDTHVIYVNGTKKYTKSGRVYTTGTVDDTGNWTISDEDTSFQSSAPVMYSLTDDASAFTFDSSNCPSGYSPLYYVTDWPVTTDTKTCTLRIQDDDGLESSVVISNKASQLNPPSLNVETSTSYGSDEDTGLYTLKITHDGFCTDGSSSGSVTINYTITETNSKLVFNSGSSSTITASSSGSAVIYLPQGTYKVTAAAGKNYYISSDEVTVTDVKITQSAVFYVSETGNDNENTGKRASPYRTINKAYDSFTDGLVAEEYEDDAECIIYVMTDLTPPDGFTDNTFINITTSSNSVQIIGLGSTRTIDAKGNSSNNRRLLYASLYSGGKLTIKNINLKGGYINSNSLNGSVYFYCDFEMIGGSITGCLAEMGDAINVNGEGIFDGVTITENTVSSVDNSVLNVRDSLTLKNTLITNNISENNIVGLTGYGAALEINGKVTINNNKKSNGTDVTNVYLPLDEIITVVGDLTGSKIGISIPYTDTDKPSVGNPLAFTSGYSTYNSSTAPGEIFIAQNGYGIALNDSGEASFAVSGGIMYTAFDYEITLEDVASVSARLGADKTLTYPVSASRKGTTIYYNSADRKLYTDTAFTQKAAGDNTVEWTAALYNGSIKACDCTVSPADGGIKVTVPAQSYEDSYTLKITATYLDVSYDTNISFSVLDPYSIPVDVDGVKAMIATGGTVEVVGVLNQETFSEIANSVPSAASNVKLDLSMTVGLETLDENVFSQTTKLEELILPEGLTTMDTDSLWCLYNLKKLHIPASCSTIVGSAFFLCSMNTGLDITLDENNQTFDLIDGAIYTKDHKKLVRFANGTSSASFTVPSFVEEICDFAFTCARLESITFEEGSNLKKIGTYAFDKCVELNTVYNLPVSVETIETAAWRYCTALMTVNYNGTLEQWNNIAKGGLGGGIGGLINHTVTVKCSNGNVTF